MRVAVVSCVKYADAWPPFFQLLKAFWPDCPYDTCLVTDTLNKTYWRQLPDMPFHHAGLGRSWCQSVSGFAALQNQPILLMQEDFFLSAPVWTEVVDRALELVENGAACVRLYPCPGADGKSIDDYFGEVTDTAEYPISCQAAVWRPDYLSKIATFADGSAADFEILGSIYSRTFPNTILAFRREVQPWPMEYLCSAISRGKWNPDAKVLCDRLGIQVDWSMRPMAA